MKAFLILTIILVSKPFLNEACSATQLCPNGLCCSKFGYCGNTIEYCGEGCQSNCPNSGAICSATKFCPQNMCCSKYGFCGTTSEYCGEGCQSNCQGNTDQGSSQYLINENQFVNALINNGFPRPNNLQFTNLVKQASQKGSINTKRELAMFLTQIMWESAGLTAKREYACLNTGCPGQYTTGIGFSGQNYYGRGYIQLSWDYNYKAASYELYGDDRLLRNADQVASNDEISWATTFWYWKKNVHNAPGVQQGNFGSSTNAINGALECRGGYQDKARKRFEIYKKVLTAFGLYETPIENGCYN